MKEAHKVFKYKEVKETRVDGGPKQTWKERKKIATTAFFLLGLEVSAAEQSSPFLWVSLH